MLKILNVCRLITNSFPTGGAKERMLPTVDGRKTLTSRLICLVSGCEIGNDEPGI